MGAATELRTMRNSKAWIDLLRMYRKRYINALCARDKQSIKGDYYLLKETVNEDLLDCGWEFIVSGDIESYDKNVALKVKHCA